MIPHQNAAGAAKRAWLALAVLGCATGCQAPPASTVSPGSEQRLATIRVFGKSHDLSDSPAYPMPDTRHILRWKAGRFEWEIMLRDRADSYVSIIRQKPLDLRRYRPKSHLRLRISPDAAAEHLYIGLADNRADGSSPVMAQRPLAPYRTWRRNALGYYAIPLKDFGDRGFVLSADWKRLPTGEEGRLDWSRIGEFRIGLLSPRAPRNTFIISAFEIGARALVSEK